MAGENCSSNCESRDHETFGECMRAKGVRPMWLGGTGPSYGDQKKWASENRELRELVRSGGSISTAVNKGLGEAYKQIGG